MPAGWCKRCGLSLKYKDKLASHIKTVHEKAGAFFNLSVCPRPRCNYSNSSQGGEQDIYIHINDVHYKEKSKGKPVKTASQASASGTSSKAESRSSDTPNQLPKDVKSKPGPKSKVGDKVSTPSTSNEPIWIYFTLEKDNATCNSCNGTMKSDPPRLIDHLKLFHKPLHNEFEEIQRMFNKKSLKVAPASEIASTPKKWPVGLSGAAQLSQPSPGQ